MVYGVCTLMVMMCMCCVTDQRDKATGTGFSQWCTEDVCWSPDWGQVTYYWEKLQLQG